MLRARSRRARSPACIETFSSGGPPVRILRSGASDLSPDWRDDNDERLPSHVAAFETDADFALDGRGLGAIFCGGRNRKRVKASEKRGDRCALNLPVRHGCDSQKSQAPLPEFRLRDGFTIRPMAASVRFGSSQNAAPRAERVGPNLSFRGLIYRGKAGRLAGEEGLEPPTPGFGDRCSTN